MGSELGFALASRRREETEDEGRAAAPRPAKMESSGGEDEGGTSRQREEVSLTVNGGKEEGRAYTASISASNKVRRAVSQSRKWITSVSECLFTQLHSDESLDPTVSVAAGGGRRC